MPRASPGKPAPPGSRTMPMCNHAFCEFYGPLASSLARLSWRYLLVRLCVRARVGLMCECACGYCHHDWPGSGIARLRLQISLFVCAGEGERQPRLSERLQLRDRVKTLIELPLRIANVLPSRRSRLCESRSGRQERTSWPRRASERRGRGREGERGRARGAGKARMLAQLGPEKNQRSRHWCRVAQANFPVFIAQIRAPDPAAASHHFNPRGTNEHKQLGSGRLSQNLFAAYRLNHLSTPVSSSR